MKLSVVAGAGDGAFRRLVVVDAGQRGADHQGVVAQQHVDRVLLQRAGAVKHRGAALTISTCSGHAERHEGRRWRRLVAPS